MIATLWNLLWRAILGRFGRCHLRGAVGDDLGLRDCAVPVGVNLGDEAGKRLAAAMPATKAAGAAITLRPVPVTARLAMPVAVAALKGVSLHDPSFRGSARLSGQVLRGGNHPTGSDQRQHSRRDRTKFRVVHFVVIRVVRGVVPSGDSDLGCDACECVSARRGFCRDLWRRPRLIHLATALAGWPGSSGWKCSTRTP